MLINIILPVHVLSMVNYQAKLLGSVPPAHVFLVCYQKHTILFVPIRSTPMLSNDVNYVLIH